MLKPLPINLEDHFNKTIQDGNPADFEVEFRKLYCRTYNNEAYLPVPHKYAVVRTDYNTPVSVVSDKYTLVQHGDLLRATQKAIDKLGYGETPSGIYVDRGGARMRALFKFPLLTRRVYEDDRICPCIKLQNTYDGTSKVSVHIGAFRFVCTNLAVGGGGVFAGGFMSVHVGEIPTDTISEQLYDYLLGFDQIVGTYRSWKETEVSEHTVRFVLEQEHIPEKHIKEIMNSCAGYVNVYDMYNTATYYATHMMRTFHTAFELLSKINHGFQKEFGTGPKKALRKPVGQCLLCGGRFRVGSIHSCPAL
jgi:hypothetical protein